MDPETPRPGADPAGRTQPGPGTGHTYGIRGGISSIVVKRPIHSRISLSNCDGLCSAGTLWAFPAATATGMYGGTERRHKDQCTLTLPSPSPGSSPASPRTPPSQAVPSPCSQEPGGSEPPGAPPLEYWG